MFLFGMEIEVENVPDPKILCQKQPYWTITTDNSLRDYGYEFITPPLRADQFEGALKQLNYSLPNNCRFTPRTSVHVHMNVRDLNIEQINSLILIYTVIEGVLFNWVGTRKDNVFCIPIIDTDYVQNYITFVNDPRDMVESWNKYTAFNMQPVCTKGTVEFRHMYGTANVNILLKWINILSKLKQFAKKYTLMQVKSTILELNSNSQYEMFIDDIFEDYADELKRTTPNLQESMQHEVSYAKLATIKAFEPERQIFAETPTALETPNNPRREVRGPSPTRVHPRPNRVDAQTLINTLHRVQLTVPTPQPRFYYQNRDGQERMVNLDRGVNIPVDMPTETVPLFMEQLQRVLEAREAEEEEIDVITTRELTNTTTWTHNTWDTLTDTRPQGGI
ncbi:MAG: amidoligase family protein [Saprospiraceae bacterium]|nr:amidoligase family protein [Candidatus Vicinibacter affinis]